jgi:hypothetical protein
MNRIQFAAACALSLTLAACNSGAPSASPVEAQGPSHSQMSGPVVRAAAVSTTTQPTWTTERDTREQAFSIQVPQGWKTFGGVFRYSAVDVRLEVDATSPDGATNLRVGDAMVPPYQVPGPFKKPGPGVAPYASGQQFATKYGQARFSAMCTGLKLTKSDAVPPKYNSPGGGLIRTTAGEAYFTCTKNGVAMTAYVYSETTLVGNGAPPSNWSVAALGSLMAPTTDTTNAGNMLAHMGQTLAMNPQWTQMQQALNNRAIQQLNANTAATIQATQAENAREQGIMAASDQQEQNFDDVINGVAYTRNTSTGQLQTVPLGTGGPQWIDGGNNVVNSALSPGASFSQLQTISR